MKVELNEKGNVLSVNADMIYDSAKTKCSAKGNITRAYKKDEYLIGDKLHAVQITCYEVGSPDAGMGKEIEVVTKKK